jgi:hypothetical protein
LANYWNCWRSYGTYPRAGTGYGYTTVGSLGFRKKISARKCYRYSKNAGILGIPPGFGFYLPEQAARNQFLPVQSDTFGCAENALKMLGFDAGAQPPGIQVPVGSNGQKRVPLLQKPTVQQNVSAAEQQERSFDDSSSSLQ